MQIRCPICKTLTVWNENSNRPFCSERCRIIDLGSWAAGEYRIEGKPASDASHSSEEDHAPLRNRQKS
ncbi:MAG TPA: DNA gyrase inhibitor YacG [Nitrospiria bacterium]